MKSFFGLSSLMVLLVCLPVAAPSPVLLVFEASQQEEDPMPKSFIRSADTVIDPAAEPTIYDCLQEAAGKDDCKSIFDGQCVWCAEPVYGLCVTASFASKIGYLPLFNCDDNDNTETDTYFDADTDTDTDAHTDTEAVEY